MTFGHIQKAFWKKKNWISVVDRKMVSNRQKTNILTHSFICIIVFFNIDTSFLIFVHIAFELVKKSCFLVFVWIKWETAEKMKIIPHLLMLIKNEKTRGNLQKLAKAKSIKCRWALVGKIEKNDETLKNYFNLFLSNILTSFSSISHSNGLKSLCFWYLLKLGGKQLKKKWKEHPKFFSN